MQMIVYSKRSAAIMKKNLGRMLLLFFTFPFTASCFSQINLSLKNVPLEKAFREIESKVEQRFVYTREMLEGSHAVSIKVRDASLSKILDIIFESQPLEYLLDERFIKVRFKPAPATAAENSIDVQGKVINEKG